MSSLARYQKSGGFIQLLSLIETFGAQKREKFLEMIEQENLAWGQALRQKVLTVERILQWPDHIAIEVFKNLPITNMAIALESLKPEHKQRLMSFFSTSEQRRLEETLSMYKLKPEDMVTGQMKLIEQARKMFMSGDLRPERFDDSMHVPEDIEAKLQQGFTVGTDGVLAQAEPAAPAFDTDSVAESNGYLSNAEMAHLQRTVAGLLKENKSLKEEVRLLRDRLDAIRRIA